MTAQWATRMAPLSLRRTGYVPHTFSPDHGYATGPSRCAEEQRGKRLGNYVNARMIAGVFRDLVSTHPYEFVSARNIPSRRMVEVPDLRHEPSLVGGVATVG